MPVETGQIGRREILGGMAFAAIPFFGATLASPVVATDLAPTSESLAALARASGRFYGAAISAPGVRDPQLLSIVREDCSLVTPETGFNATRTWRQPPDPFDFTEADALYAFAQASGLPMRGGHLVWYRALPAWMKAQVPAMSAGATEALLADFVGRTATAWRGRVTGWNAVNEATPGGGKLNPSVFSDKLGDRYIDIAFHAAHEADPAAQLALNQELIELDTPDQDRRRAGTLVMLEALLRRGVPVQALGIQGHLLLDTSFSEAKYRAFLDAVRDMGLKILVTEFDVLDRGIAGDVARRDDASAALAKAFLDVTLDYANCEGVISWAETDRYSWLRAFPDKQRSDSQPLRPTLRDDQGHKKPLFSAMAQAFRAAPQR